MERYIKQCMKYVSLYFYYKPDNNRNDIETKDIVGEMVEIIWKSYVNRNGVSKLVETQKLLPSWQIRKIFLHALRNLKLLQDDQPYHYPNPAQVIKNEDGEIVNFYLPPDDPDPEPPELHLNEIEKRHGSQR